MSCHDCKEKPVSKRCQECKRGYWLASYYKNIGNRKKYSRRNRLQRDYGITLSQYDEMLANQESKCAICGRFSNKPLFVDHCHSSGRVRGLLCSQCNFGLGQFEDNPDVLRKAIEYIS